MLAFNAFSTVFTVINNADSGTGTLRDMLTKAAANGIADADVINFNLTDQSEAGRTIVILDQLPLVSANLTIDGSSQPGTAFGLSTSRVKILTGFAYTKFANVLLLENVQDVKIYGLYIKNEMACPSGEGCYYWQGIAIRDCRNIEIGAAGKGNVILGFQYDLGMNLHLTGGQIHYYSVNFTLKANFIGIEPDGITRSDIISKPVEVNYVIGEINIGGTPDEGNLFPNGFSIHQTNSENYTGEGVEMYVTPATIRFRNNKIGVDHSESITFPSSGFRFDVHTPKGKNTVFIEDNIISSSTAWGITLINNFHEVNIRRNYIGTDRSLTKTLPVGDTGIFVYYCTNVKIGSSNPADKNYIANCKPINVWPYSTVSVNKNSFFCVRNMYPMIYRGNGTFFFPVVKISSITGTSLSGNATPGSAIELFYADRCGSCAPETYFASTTADESGNWHYDGPIQGKVIASATFNGATSEFTRPELDVANVKIENTCPNYGSIKGIVPSSYTDISWINESGAEVGRVPDLLNMPPGKYKLKIGYGDCSAETPWYQIKLGVSVDASTIAVTNASCNGANGSVKGITITNNTSSAVQYSWKDAGGNEMGRALKLENVRPGNYLLSIKLADNSCAMSYGPVEIKNISGPGVSEHNITVVASECGKAEGSIAGISATGLGVLRYQWKNELGEVVGTGLDLLDKPAGSYKLEVFDESACGSVFSSTIPIPEVNGISLNDMGTIQNVTCGQSNGSITGIQVSGATQYQWFDQSDQLIATTTDPNLRDVKAGRYYLVAANSSCKKTSQLYTVGGNVAVLVNNNHVQINHDHCSLSTGTITGIEVSGKLPFSYRWENDAGVNFGNQKDLKNAPQGIYHLTITDAAGCSAVSTYQLLNQSESIQQPMVSDLQLCGKGEAILIVNNVTKDSGYKLYGNEYGLIPLDVQESGQFKINVNENRKFYVSRYIGGCESPRTKVEVTVGYAALIIPNAFSPNHDGSNDKWIIKGIENYPKVSVNIFNRYGERVFDAPNYKVPFEGNRNGNPLPAGVYYYVIKIGEGCRAISGSLTLLR
ncbi:gliding motility-associated C-terminal domain-containing protein [Pedobacter nyackensis]|uniref:Gliding motility-associated C-terminal domain-containing protein n=1 Tax=Pedobacter nyackensis TaxID=475255 RepID=A0A1W2EG70_9SPHI|nr:gliding motility-associated C-terminal domain-containing protein [Pedobacter nyackensis]SMD08703.1 gliding motility-associated C-terminal domain-containing protein [Pedobacter nyackensis]